MQSLIQKIEQLKDQIANNPPNGSGKAPVPSSGLNKLYHILLRRLKIRANTFLKRNSIGVKTITARTTAIANRKHFSIILNSAIHSGRLQARCLKLITVKTLEKIPTYDKLRIASIQKRTSKSVVMSGATYLYMTRLQKMGFKFMPKVAQICLRINGRLCEIKSTIHTRSFDLAPCNVSKMERKVQWVVFIDKTGNVKGLICIGGSSSISGAAYLLYK